MNQALTYEELLKDRRWQAKRLEILERDAFKCMHCNNASLDKETHCGQGIRTYQSTNSVTYGILNTKPVKFVQLTLKGALESFSFDPYLIFYYREEMENVDVIALRKIEQTEVIEKNGFLLVPNPLPATSANLTWVYNSFLHVHHTYYQQNCSPWEYPNGALITLCWKCHKLVHEDQKVPVLDRTGYQICLYTPCSRCYGAGILPQYDHVENGICFRCRGFKYEDLIS